MQTQVSVGDFVILEQKTALSSHILKFLEKGILSKLELMKKLKTFIVHIIKQYIKKASYFIF